MEVIMPGFDKTGPEGLGPMTGRRMGRCTNFGARNKGNAYTDTDNTDQDAGRSQYGFGAGAGFGSGRGRGFRNWRPRGRGLQNRFRNSL
jgi:hypothetical protein